MFSRTLRLALPSLLYSTEAVNMEQRPNTFPMANVLLPTLLRGASMWLMERGAPLTGEAGCLDTET